MFALALFQNGPTEALQLGGVIVLAFGLIKVIERLIDKSSGQRAGFYGSDRDKLSDLHATIPKVNNLERWHQPTDDGRQEWKNPEIRKLLSEISETLKVIAAQGEA